ncbi:MAG: S9 family peptidase [Idiomarina sp.]|nr:S9 family peptidase [Idiomarina sp.]
MLLRTLTLSILFLAGCATSTASDSPRPITAEDYYQMSSVSQVTVSPDGKSIAFVRTTVSEDRRSRESSIWLHREGETTPQRFTYGTSDRGPQFAPDGKSLLFFANRSEGSGLYQIPTTGGEARKLLGLEQGAISAAAWHPNGEQLLLTVSLPADVTDPQEKAERDSSPKPDIDVIEYAVYKRQGGYLDDRRTSLWLYTLADNELSRLTPDEGYSVNSASWSPSGERVVFAANRHPEAREGVFSQDLLVWHADTGVQVLDALTVHASSPVWLDDTSILYVHRADNYAAPSLVRYNLTQASNHMVAAEMDHGPGNLISANGEAWFIADHRGSRAIFAVDFANNGYRYVTGTGFSLSSFSVAHDGSAFAWVRENEVNPPEVVRGSAPDNRYPTLTDFNQSLAASLELVPYEVFTAENERGDELDIFFVRPVGHRGNASAPLILNIKGGPGGMWGHQWFPEKQLMAARGYAVVFVNYRGSTGYGYDHQQQVRLDYGGADYRDNMVAVDAALAQYPWLDESRVFITGGSHGGFLTNWATTQTDRFRAAVTQRSVSNWLSEAGTQAFPPVSMRVEFGGTIWENFDYYWGRSPLKYADRVSTPTLIIHSTDDHITPIGQGEEWFYALKANDVPVEMVIFRGEGHGLSRSGRPVNLVERLNRIVDWFERHND